MFSNVQEIYNSSIRDWIRLFILYVSISRHFGKKYVINVVQVLGTNMFFWGHNFWTDRMFSGPTIKRHSSYLNVSLGIDASCPCIVFLVNWSLVQQVHIKAHYCLLYIWNWMNTNTSIFFHSIKTICFWNELMINIGREMLLKHFFSPLPVFTWPVV